MVSNGFHDNQVVDRAETDFISCKTSLELSYMLNYNLPGLTSTQCSSEAQEMKLWALTVRKLPQEINYVALSQ